MQSLELYVGLVAGILTAISLLPQLIKVIRKKKVDDISIVYLCVLLAGLSLWVWYGILREDLPIIITNSFSVLVNLSLMVLVLIYKRKD